MPNSIGRPRAGAVRIALPLALALAFPSCGPREPDRRVVAVETVKPNGAGARAGLRPGDLLLSWRRKAAPPANPREAGGPIRSCTELPEIEVEQAPRGPVELRLARDGEILSVEMPPGEWELAVRPLVPGHEECVALARGQRLADERRWPEAHAAYEEAARQAGRHGRKLYRAFVLQQRGVASMIQDDFPAAEKAFQVSLRLRQEVAPESLFEASIWLSLGWLEQSRGEIDASEKALRRALRLRSRHAPGSLAEASTLNNLATNAWYRNDLDAARRLYEQAFGLIRKRFPGSSDEALVLNNLGLLARATGDLRAAERHFTESARLWQRLDPESTEIARTFSNLGALAMDRGDYALAEEYHRDALRRFEAIAPDGRQVALSLQNLGMLARERHQYAEADALLRRALAIQREQVPGSAEEATTLSNLASISLEWKRLDEAERFARQALGLRRQLSPVSTEVAVSVSMLGRIAWERGDRDGARRLAGEALAIQRQAAPGTNYEAQNLQFLGNTAFLSGRYAEAERYLRQALAIHRRLAPRSQDEATTLDLLGLALWKSGRAAESMPVFVEAVEALEAQIGRLGGSDESRSSFQARHVEIYWDLMQLQIEQGDAAAALHTLERSRARSLLDMLAERDLVFSADLPARLLEQQRRLDRDYEATQEAIAGTDPRQTAELEALLARLTRLRNERSALAGGIAKASPRYASLRHPRPLGLDGIRRTLDPGTVWLSYCVTGEATLLFVVTPDEGVRVFRRPANVQEIERLVSAFRGLILRGREHPALEPALLAQGRQLWDLLISPVAHWIGRAQRVLISPDGPLHTLPFAALVRPAAQPGEPPLFLAEWKPLHTVLSATLYAELKRGRQASRTGESPRVVAFADPRYRPAAGAAADPWASPLARYRRGLPPLPASREEVRSLASLYGSNATAYLGAAATEARAKRLPARPRILHFATHALLDRRFPLDSALALSVPGGADEDDNGLLQAWEIFERLRLDADLVTLSACETGLGRDAAGEGLIGLTRAFQYAGARSVLASLWAVSDRSTAELMRRFYTRLRAGQPKDVALQQAQRELLHSRDPRLVHPYHWAAFELIGDGR